MDSTKRSPARRYRQLYENISSDGSRYDLYVDEDNVLRELVRFNNDIDLILSRLDMEGETLPALEPMLIEETPAIDEQ